MGAKTSGSGECPFSDVRSPSTAPPVPPQLPRARGLRERVPDALHILRCAAPVRPHLPITAQLVRVHRSRGPRGPHTCWGPRPNGPSTSLGSLRARRREPPGLRGPLLSGTSPAGEAGSLCCESVASPEGTICVYLG